jgi:DNA-binding transcriptional LysR family regulator
MPITFRQLEIFVAAAEEGNFRRSADRLGISQPGLSKQIRALELAMSKVLFERRRGAGAVLSKDGEEMLTRARDLINQRRMLVPPLEDALAQNVRVVSGDYLLEHVIKPALPELYRLFPRVIFECVAVDGTKSVMEVVRANEADLGVTTGPRHTVLEDDVTVVCEVPCSLYASAKAAERLLGHPADVAKEPLILPASSRAGSWVINALREAGLHFEIVAARVQFGDVLADMIRQRFGLGVLFDEHVDQHFAGELIRLPVNIRPAHRLLVQGAKLRPSSAAPLLRHFSQLIDRSSRASKPASLVS